LEVGRSFILVLCHRIEWQFKQKQGCDRHQLTLLSPYNSSIILKKN
jgi:hypothetical protein